MHIFIKILLFIGTVSLLITTYLHPITAITQDLGRHIKTGEIIVQTHTVPKTNLYSYTYPDFPFINHHWGSEVVFFVAYQLGGYSATLLLTFFASIIAFLLLYWYSYKAKVSFLALSLVSFLSLGMLVERTDVRPEAFSMLLFALYLVILFTNRKDPTKWLYVLIPLQLLWTNLHIYFAIGILTIGLFLVDALFSFFIAKTKNKETRKHILSLCIVFVASSLVSLLNPHGVSGVLYPLRVFDNYGYSIEENQNIFFLWELFQKRTIVFFWISLVAFFTVMSIRVKQTHLIGWLLGIVFAVLAIQAIRNFPLFVFAIFIPFTYQLSALLKPIEKHSKVFLLLSIFLFILFFWQISAVLQVKPFGFTTPPGAANAVDFMERNNLKGPLFNNFDIGSYLIFRLYPSEKVFVDGRPESYPADFFQKIYIPMQQDQKLFTEMDKKYQFNTIFFSHTDQTPWAKQFLRDIVKNPAWKIVYLDDTVIILTKMTNNQKALSLTSYTPSSDTIQGLYQLLLFFQTIEDGQNMQKTAETILEKDPHDCVALALLSQTTNGIAYFSRYHAVCQ